MIDITGFIISDTVFIHLFSVVAHKFSEEDRSDFVAMLKVRFIY